MTPGSIDATTGHFIGLILAIVLAAVHGRIGTAGPFWQILYALPATLLHELSHLVIAFITGGRPAGFSIIPTPRLATLADGTVRRGWVLGSVTIRNAGLLASFPTGLAPLLLIPLAWFLYRHWFAWFPADLPHTLFLYLAVYLCTAGAVPSTQDLRVAFSSLAGVALYGTLLVFVWVWRSELAMLFA
ncbi:hypothetical protein [Geobacter sp. AOG1]|uniref:hypothetical protein n=1 Tax=Geobacter sp. AOG1 TaxID=1566346 RepID=UPI001CC6BDAC|nr:hypothetical protein [Geobacter sp. AOG1]GFE56565.1 hypothetical protein AOG1_04440 [Geobacter sp. AOG1]